MMKSEMDLLISSISVSLPYTVMLFTLHFILTPRGGLSFFYSYHYYLSSNLLLLLLSLLLLLLSLLLFYFRYQ